MPSARSRTSKSASVWFACSLVYATIAFTPSVAHADAELAEAEPYGRLDTSSASLAAQAPYSDITPSDTHYDNILALAGQGIFRGTECGADRFCPDDPIDRATMAVWVVRILDGHDPPPGPSRFPDVNSQLPAFWSSLIERLAELGVTKGCGDGTNFCPFDPVTRAQTAVFLTRAFDLPDGPNPGFSDVDQSYWASDHIAALADSGITRGCGDGSKFCPKSPTSRAQMAAFLSRATQFRPITRSPSIDTGFEPLYALVSGNNLNGPVDFDVHYCGKPNDPSAPSAYTMSELTRQVTLLQTHVDEFYRAESRYDASGNGTTINFVVGQILEPPDNWTLDTLGRWSEAYTRASANYIPGYTDPCREAAADAAVNDPASNYPRSIILVNRPRQGTYGYAWKGGPVVAATYEQHGRDEREFLHTIAHEVGHAYGWKHPWEDLGLDVFGNTEDRRKYVTEEIEKARSLMSYEEFHGSTVKIDIRSTADTISRSYIACYQRQAKNWTDSCRAQILTPEDPAAPILMPRDRSLVVSWTAPNDRGAEIIDYELQYRPRGSNQSWIDVPVGNEQSVTITRLTNNVEYSVQLRAENQVGRSDWSAPAVMAPRRSDRPDEPTLAEPIVVVTVGSSTNGQAGAVCAGPACRWLEIDVLNPEALGPGPYTLACAHNGVDATGAERGVYDSATVSAWPATRSCSFGYPGSEVFVVVGAERRGNIWHGGYYSESVVWPSPQDDDLSVRISWGSDASSRSLCPRDTRCLNLDYEYIGPWPDPPYQLECWVNGQQRWTGRWSGVPETACMYWDGTAQVVINGIRSNTITFPDDPSELELRISWGSDASSRSLCPRDTRCLNLDYEYIGPWPDPPYQLECWVNGQQRWTGRWSGVPETACMYWDGTAQVVINGIRSNTITFPS